MNMNRKGFVFEVKRVCGRWCRATIIGKETRKGIAFIPGEVNALGGFLKAKDFDLYFAAKCAMDNAISIYQGRGI